MSVQRAALGRVAGIGSLYDIRTERFLADTVFGKDLDECKIRKTDLPGTHIELVQNDVIQEKFNTLEVEAELQLSVLSGLVKLQGSGSYVGEEKKSDKAQRMSMIYKVKTVKQEIDVRQNKDQLDKGVLLSLEEQNKNKTETEKPKKWSPTHVVVGIDWGAVCVVTCEYKNVENEDSTKVEGRLSVEIEKLKAMIDAGVSAGAKYEDKDVEQLRDFTFTYKGDVSAPGKLIPDSFEGAVQFARNMPVYLESVNDGKGVPLTYYLMPLNTVLQMCDTQLQLDTEFKEVDEASIKMCTQVLQNISDKRQLAYDIQHDLRANKNYVSGQSLKDIDDILGKITVEESRFRQRLQEVVKRVRSGGEISFLDEFLSEQKPEVISSSKYKLEAFQKDLNHVKRINMWESRGIIYIGRDDLLITDKTPTVVVFYRNANATNTQELGQNQTFFLQLQATHKGDDDYEFIIVDKHIRSDLWPTDLRKPTIRKFVRGSLKSEDLYSDEGQDTDMCLIKIGRTSDQHTNTNNHPNVNVRCPNSLSGNTKCTDVATNWRCSKCKALVEYGKDAQNDTMFYCKCGASKSTEAKFRCNNEWHGMDYIEYPGNKLLEDLWPTDLTRRTIPKPGKAAPKFTMNGGEDKDINILLLGETGVGKSTWINGFQNYLIFADLEEAVQSNDFHVLIPSSFAYTQEGEEKQMKIGDQDPNEVQETGKYATKQPRSYDFRVGGAKIRLIDTPSIGDSEGMQGEKENVENVLSYLSHFEEIHAVCILLKPNYRRLTATFQFSIQELLSHLHSSAKHNIVFCFTNTRATFYQPGDTLPALNQELRERDVGIKATPDNYFCFDNESFRLLACVQNGVELVSCKTDVETYITSWKRSVAESWRFISHVTSLTPHNIQDTISMNEAQRIIIGMSKPLVEVTETINRNMLAAEDPQRRQTVQAVDTNAEMKKEEKLIMETGARFGSFHKSTALIPCNDAVEEHIDMSIEQEKMKPNEIRNDALVKKMQNIKTEYQKQIQILDNAKMQHRVQGVNVVQMK